MHYIQRSCRIGKVEICISVQEFNRLTHTDTLSTYPLTVFIISLRTLIVDLIEAQVNHAYSLKILDHLGICPSSLKTSRFWPG